MRIKHRLDMENVLTPEQKAKLEQLRRMGRNVRERIIDRIQVPRFFRFERKMD